MGEVVDSCMYFTTDHSASEAMSLLLVVSPCNIIYPTCSFRIISNMTRGNS